MAAAQSDTCLGNYVDPFQQAQVYYVGFCENYEIEHAVDDIYKMIDLNSKYARELLTPDSDETISTPNYIYFSCSEQRINNISDGKSKTDLNTLLASNEDYNVTIAYEIDPIKFLEILEGNGEKGIKRNCIVTIYAHGVQEAQSTEIGTVKFSNNCQNEKKGGAALVDDGEGKRRYSLRSAANARDNPCDHASNVNLTGEMINEKLKKSQNLFIFVFISCYAYNFMNSLTSDNIIAFIPTSCSTVEIPEIRNNFPDIETNFNFDDIKYAVGEQSKYIIDDNENKESCFKKKLGNQKFNYYFFSESESVRKYNENKFQSGLLNSDDEFEYEYEYESEGGRKIFRRTKKNKKKTTKKMKQKIKTKKKKKKNKKKNKKKKKSKKLKK